MANNITYYSWWPYFKALGLEILNIAQDKETRDQKLMAFANQIFEPGTPIFDYPLTDPFSFFYSIAQRNTKNQRQNIFSKLKDVLTIPEELPTDFIFPTPTPNTLSLFFYKGNYINAYDQFVGSDCLWNLFEQVFTSAPVNNEDFMQVLSLKNVGFTKLSQTMFLMNPLEYMPFDTQMNKLPVEELSNLTIVNKNIEEKGIDPYLEVLNLLKKSFPGCNFMEINLLNYLLNNKTGDRLKISNRYCQVSSNIYGQDEKDYFEDFVIHNAVYTGGATTNGGTEYPLKDYNIGDVVLVRRGTKWLGGIGIILANTYIPNGFTAEDSIKIVWLVKDDRKIETTALGQWDGFSHATINTISKFSECYPETFKILDQIRQNQKTMIDHSSIKFKNIILQGPPGTGKTRLALQIAEWLTDDTAEKSLSIMDAVEAKIFTKEPDIEENAYVELIQFHPSYTYDDFVRGIKVNVGEKGISYDVENKILAKIARDADAPENQDKAFVLIIDEINRANLNTVLGELIYALEYRGKSVSTMYEFEKSRKLIIPQNLYIIGTMNTADRSVSHLDYAIRRRFTFIPVESRADVISDPKAKQLYDKIANLIKDNISPEFDVENIQIGHSYFLADEKTLISKLKYEIKPLLKEYIYDGILLPSAKEEISNLSV